MFQWLDQLIYRVSGQEARDEKFLVDNAAMLEELYNPTDPRIQELYLPPHERAIKYVMDAFHDATITAEQMAMFHEQAIRINTENEYYRFADQVLDEIIVNVRRCEFVVG